MAEPSASPLSRWRYGMHPRAVGMQVRSLGRVDVPLGEALRLEMVDADPGGEDIVHLQYYISTGVGPWALWLSCARGDLAGQEATLQEITPSFTGESQEQSPGRHGGRAPFAGWEG
jgi:hypothetical protein